MRGLNVVICPRCLAGVDQCLVGLPGACLR
jgi:hypothetical protein